MKTSIPRILAKGAIFHKWLGLLGNIPFGTYEQAARNPHDAFIGATIGGWRQTILGFGHVYADYGEVTRLQFPNVRAVLQRGSLRTVGVRIGTDAAEEIGVSLHGNFFNIEHIRCQHAFESGFKYGVTERQVLKRIGENVKAARLKANLTQECLAELVGVHWQTISYIENGRNPFSVIILAKLAPALQTSPNRLLEGLPAPNLERQTRIKNALARKRSPRESDRISN